MNAHRPSCLLGGCASKLFLLIFAVSSTTSLHAAAVETKLHAASTPQEIDQRKLAAPPAVNLPLVKAQGRLWVQDHLNGTTNSITLQGTNIGNWLLQEFWMMGLLDSGVEDQCGLEEKLEARFGAADKDTLLKTFHDNWISDRDWDIIASFGFNVVRLPLLWNVMEDENNPMTLKVDAWDYVDETISQAAQRGMYTILDMHGVVGGQGVKDHSGCTNQNLYWNTTEYQDRTIWLWEQIATRYKDDTNVAAYGLLNEPWGSTKEALADRTFELYDAVRAIDSNHVIILHDHQIGGITAYGNPAVDRNMVNFAFETHLYPGLYGGNPENLDAFIIHRNWLEHGIKKWDARIAAVNAPLLIGEFQPWQGSGLDKGGKIARATYDTYASYGFAATSWTYKIITLDGGSKSGTWGLVTNSKVGSKLASASTWGQAGWDLTFTESIKIDFVGTTKTYYIALKAGGFGSTFDVVFDNISLVNVDTQVDVISNGEFGSNQDWSKAKIGGSIAWNFDSSPGPSGGQGSALQFYRTGSGYANGVVYQAVTLTSGQRYDLTGSYKDNGSADTWAEVYLLADKPKWWKDINPDAPDIDFDHDDFDTIKAVYESYGTREYEVHDGLKHWLTASTPSGIFDQPFDVETTIPATIQSEAYASMQGVELESGWIQGYGKTWNLAHISAGDFFEYAINVPSSGTYTIKYHVACGSSGGSYGFTLSVDGTVVSTQAIPNTGGWSSWQDTTSPVVLPAGGQMLRFTALGGGGFNIDWFELALP